MPKANYLYITVNFECEHCGCTSSMYIKDVKEELSFKNVAGSPVVNAWVKCPECEKENLVSY